VPSHRPEGCVKETAVGDRVESEDVVCVDWVPVLREVIAVGVRWYLRYARSYRDVEELLAERGTEVHSVTIYR
jgi:hypothetical protein